MIHDTDRLAEIFSRPLLARLVERLQARLRLGRALESPITLPQPTPNERSAIDHLLNRKSSRGSSVSVQPRELDRIFAEAGICDSLEEALTSLFPDIVATRNTKEAMGRSWTQQLKSAADAFSDLPPCKPWLEKLIAGGRLKRQFPADPLGAAASLQVVAAMIRDMPYPVLSLAELATRLTGDSHALDRGTPLSHLCLSALIALQPEPEGVRSRRQLWDSAGVVIDELSAPVLVLNLRAKPGTLLGGMLNPLADAGEPCHLSVRLLRRAGIDVFTDGTVAVCENPSVVAAAAQRLGARSRPLICIAGQPASAAQLLLSILQRAGTRMLYHGDFDAAGVLIANGIIQRFGALPWRMSPTDYLASSHNGPSLANRIPPAIWNPDLAAAMQSRGSALLEESVLDTLLSDLDSTVPSRP